MLKAQIFILSILSLIFSKDFLNSSLKIWQIWEDERQGRDRKEETMHLKDVFFFSSHKEVQNSLQHDRLSSSKMKHNIKFYLPRWNTILVSRSLLME
jgi:hypothetical protein